MKDLGYGEGYRYSHDYPGHFVQQAYLPESIGRERFWQSDESNGAEAKMMERQRSRWQGASRPRQSPRSKPPLQKAHGANHCPPMIRSVSFHRPVSRSSAGHRRIVSLAQRCEATE